MDSNFEEAAGYLLGWGVLALATSPLALCVWCLRRRRPLTPVGLEPMKVSWDGADIFAAFFLVQLVIPPLCFVVLNKSGVLGLVYGHPLTANSTAGTEDLDRVRLTLWVAIMAFPLQALTVPVLLTLRHGTRAAALGLTTRRFALDSLRGWLVWVVLTPIVAAVHIGVSWVYGATHGLPPDRHPVQQLAEARDVLPVEWVLLIGSAVIAAPFLEELLFRGLVQPWLSRRSYGNPIVWGVCLGLAFLDLLHKRGLPPIDRLSEWPANVRDLEPAVFVVLLGPGVLLFPRLVRRWLPDPNVSAAIYTTSLFFAISHVSVWPTPVPLFLLALGLGYLAHRTGSLVGPILCHSLFNGVACVTLLGEALSR